MDFDPLNSRWHESVERDDPAPSYINIELSSGLALKICQEDLMTQIEAGNIEAEPARGGEVFNLARKFTAADRRFLRACGVAAESRS